jgi:hypothetical protein
MRAGAVCSPCNQYIIYARRDCSSRGDSYIAPSGPGGGGDCGFADYESQIRMSVYRSRIGSSCRRRIGINTHQCDAAEIGSKYGTYDDIFYCGGIGCRLGGISKSRVNDYRILGVVYKLLGYCDL